MNVEVHCSIASYSSDYATMHDEGTHAGVIEVPLKSIRRPLARTRSNNQEKVEALVKSIGVRGLLVPIDILEVDGTLSSSLFQ